MLNFHKRKLDFVLDDESCIVKLIVFTRYNVSVNFLSPAFDEFELEFKLFCFIMVCFRNILTFAESYLLFVPTSVV